MPTRRTFLKTAAIGSTLLGARGLATGAPVPGSLKAPAFAFDENQIRIFSPRFEQRTLATVVADTHLFRDDARGFPYREYSGRMAKAYNRTRHYKTNAETSPEQGLIETLAMARDNKSDLFAMVGDIFSFPSEAAIDWVGEAVAGTGLPYLYVAGNHDWHYEGMEGTSESLRADWIRKRLASLYQGRDPMMACHTVNGIRFLAIDNSTYEISEAQLAFFNEHAASGAPLVLLVHIPLYAKGRPVSFGCGHPNWGAATDKNFRVERRPQWPEAGHTEITKAFHRTVFSSRSLLCILAGHTHRQSMDWVNGIPQVVAEPNLRGGFLTVEFVPVPV